MSKRGFVWLICPVCSERNYRTERYLPGRDKVAKTNVKDAGGRLRLKKYCSRCVKHTLHTESRKK